MTRTLITEDTDPADFADGLEQARVSRSVESADSVFSVIRDP